MRKVKAFQHYNTKGLYRLEATAAFDLKAGSDRPLCQMAIYTDLLGEPLQDGEMVINADFDPNAHDQAILSNLEVFIYEAGVSGNRLVAARFESLLDYENAMIEARERCGRLWCQTADRFFGPAPHGANRFEQVEVDLDEQIKLRGQAAAC